MQKHRAVGIDLATTNSLIALIDDDNHPRTIRTSTGALSIPSAVHFDGDQVYVGTEALEAVVTNPEDVALWPKRDVGEEFFHQEVAGRDFLPQVLMGFIIRKLVAEASNVVPDLSTAVVSVPAYYDNNRRNATIEAAQLAGLDVLQILNEPTAAAISYAHSMQAMTCETPRNFAVFDLGGGTFDVSVLNMTEDAITILATEGDVRLGGNDWDLRLVDHVAELYRSKYGTDPRDNLESLTDLWKNCESAKRTLSARNETAILCRVQGRADRFPVSKELFEMLTADLLDRTMSTTRHAILQAGLDAKSLDGIILAGGSSRMPAVTKQLESLTGSQPIVSNSLDEAVAHGAAIHCSKLLDQNASKIKRVTNVNSHSLGVIGFDRQTKTERNATMIPKNSKLPATSKRNFRIQRDGQRSVLVRVIEGETPSPAGCEYIGQCKVNGLPNDIKAGDAVTVRFTYGVDGRLQVSVFVDGSEQGANVELDRPVGMSAEEINSWHEYIVRTLVT